MHSRFNAVPLLASEKAPLPPSSHAIPTSCTDPVRVVVDLCEPKAARSALISFAIAHGLDVQPLNSGPRHELVMLSGDIGQMQVAFNTKLTNRLHKPTGQVFRAREGMISVPDTLAPHVRAVMGLDDRPIAAPRIRGVRPRQQASGAIPAPAVAYAYHFPQNLTGKGRKIALIELGGGFQISNSETYFAELKLKVPTLRAVSVNGAANSPGGDADGEVELDIQVAGAVANDAEIAVYFAPDTDAGFVSAIRQATADGVDVISISWGSAESEWTVQSRNSMNAAIEDAITAGIPVLVAAGDDGANDGADGLNVDFPASSPWSTACGGTSLVLKADGSIEKQTVWNDGSAGGSTGGGISQIFPLPTYQEKTAVPHAQDGFVGRGVPDVAGNADPNTGYPIVVAGEWAVVGGTSAVAPLFAGLIACLREGAVQPMPFLNPVLYAHSVCWDVRSGNNNEFGTGGYSAHRGWDPCTGLGSIRGNALAEVL